MKQLVFALGGDEALAERLATAMYAEHGTLELRHFPDGETYLRFGTPVAGREVVLLCSLNDPDAKTLALLFAAYTAKDLGATRVGLAAPYLGYMRQDTRFRAGEAISANLYAALLSRAFDWLVTVDPHLHRHAGLEEVFSIPTRVAHAAPLLAQWIVAHCRNAFVVGPDAESEQWVAMVASGANVPHVTLSKKRHGDREVEIALPDLSAFRGRVPVLVDDIVSSGHTLAVAARRLREAGFEAPLCIAVHALFAAGASEALAAAGVARVVTTDTVAHPSNAISVVEPLALAAYAALDAQSLTPVKRLKPAAATLNP